MLLYLQLKGQKNLGRINVIIILLLIPFLLFAKRIVSLGPAVTNQILLLKSGDEIVGKTSYCPVEAGKKSEVKVIGSLLSISIESILAMKPDIVFASGLTPPSISEQLENFGINVVTVDDPSSFEMLCNNFMKIAKALEKEELGDSIVTVAKAKYDSLVIVSRGEFKKSSFLELSPKPLYTVIKGSLGDELLMLLGGKNIFNLNTNGQVDFESVIARNPELIIISGMGESTKKEVQRWMKFQNIRAVKNNKIFVVDAYNIGSPTPLSFIETVKKLRSEINNE